MLICAYNILGGVGKRWVNPYATDGLVGMWDAEWNAGGGVHDATANVVSNLAEQSFMGDMILSGNYTIQNKGIRINSNAINKTGDSGIGYVTLSSSLAGVRSIEMVLGEYTVNADSSKQYFTAWLIGGNSCPCLYITPSDVFHSGHPFPSLGLYSSRWDNTIIDESHIFMPQSSQVQTVGVIGGDGVREHEFGVDNGARIPCSGSRVIVGLLSTAGTIEFFNRSSDFNRPFNGVVYAVRIYNRILSADEVAANNAIDRTRFAQTA